jgi:SAM-dependent methyltransferase
VDTSAGRGPRLSALSDLGITREEIALLFNPFVLEEAANGPGGWDHEVSRRKRKVLKRCFARLARGGSANDGRSESAVQAEYSAAWARMRYEAYTLAPAASGHTPWLWHGRRMLAVDTGATRVRQLLIARIVERARPRSVLEVGCGNGINLILLACRFPEIEFTGIELTEAGHRAALEFQKQAALPEAMREYAPLPLADPTAFRRITFLQGNAAQLPFADAQFDLVFSVLALEQMERIRRQVLAEFARVAGKHTLMIEPFRDVNAAFWQRSYVFGRGYFRGRMSELPEYGLSPVLAIDDFPQEFFMHARAVLAEKTGPAAAVQPAR